MRRRDKLEQTGVLSKTNGSFDEWCKSLLLLMFVFAYVILMIIFGETKTPCL